MVPVRIAVSVTGMACASCVRHVENALAGKKGILGVSVSLGKGQANVDYDPALVSPDDIRRMIKGAGYGVAQAGDDMNKR